MFVKSSLVSTIERLEDRFWAYPLNFTIAASSSLIEVWISVSVAQVVGSVMPRPADVLYYEFARIILIEYNNKVVSTIIYEVCSTIT